jgi:hypothetical protein
MKKNEYDEIFTNLSYKASCFGVQVKFNQK